MEKKFTPGPWQWELNERGKRVVLCGGKRRYDLSVMDFTRWGMQGATPRFLSTNDGMKFLHEAKDYAEIVPGREHHADWFKTISHPDALLIAAAPELLEALESALQFVEELKSHGITEWTGEQSARAAISKALSLEKQI